MSKKNDHDKKDLSEAERLNQRVDAMMDPKLPDPPPAKKSDIPPLDIFEDTKTAPEVSGKLLDKVDDKVEPAPQPAQPEPVASKPEPAKTSGPKPVPPKDPVGPKDDPLDDEATDKAVTDIASKEGNTLLALQDALGRKASRTAGNLAQEDMKKARRRRWAWLIFIVAFVILVLLALPLNPYTCRWPAGIRLRVTTDILPSVCK